MAIMSLRSTTQITSSQQGTCAPSNLVYICKQVLSANPSKVDNVLMNAFKRCSTKDPNVRIVLRIGAQNLSESLKTSTQNFFVLRPCVQKDPHSL
jgi:hypothetical protein